LFSWLRAFDNIAYPLKLMGLTKPDSAARVERLVANLGVKIDLRPLSLSAVRRTAAAGLDHAGTDCRARKSCSSTSRFPRWTMK